MATKPEKQRKPSRTLFDPAYQGHRAHFKKYEHYPYPWVIRSLDANDDQRFDETELSIFSDVLELESPLYWANSACIAGPITIQVGSQKPANLRNLRKPYFLPMWVESDGLRFSNCKADGIIFVERLVGDDRRRWLDAWRSVNHILFVGNGIPRAKGRRALHRLAEETGLPVYVVTDCDTWGYFTFSLLKRGILAPHEECPYVAIKNLKYIGLRVGDFPEFEELRKPWKSHWSLRLKHLKKYSCFRSAAWQRELKAFEKQHASLELWPLLNKISPKGFIHDYLLPKIKRKDWLT